MSINSIYADLFAKVTESAAISASKFRGKNDKISADQAAVDAMRVELNLIKMCGKIVIGEGEMDEAPMLYINEKVGTNTGPEFDIAVDPLEGTNFTAKDLPNALAVIAISEKGNLLNAPDIYMKKIAVGPNLPLGIVDLDYSIDCSLKIHDHEIELCESLIKSVLNHWKKMENTSVETFRSTFLMRDAVLNKDENSNYILHVDKKPYDLLLSSIPWNIKSVQTIFMKNKISDNKIKNRVS